MISEQEALCASEIAQTTETEPATRTEMLLAQLLEEQKQQGKQLRRQLQWMQWVAAGCIAMAITALVLCVTVVPKAATLLGKANVIATEVQTTVQSLSESLPQTLQKVDSLVQTSSSGLTQALTDVQVILQKLGTLDIQSLNQAISDLANVVRPLASLFGK